MGGPAIHRDEGFSLAEVLVTVVILGITFTAILGGLMTSIRVSDFQRTEATADAVARSAAEWVKDSVRSPLLPCGTAAAYASALAGLPKPSGYSATVTSVDYWDGVTPTAGTSPNFSWTRAQCQSAGARGLQRITIVATSPDGQVVEQVQMLKRVVS